MILSETRLLALLDTLRYELTDDIKPNVVAFPPKVYYLRERVPNQEIHVNFPGSSLIIITILKQNDKLRIHVAPSGDHLNETTQEIREGVVKILKKILPQSEIIDAWKNYRRNADDELRKAQRKWQAISSDENLKKLMAEALRASVCYKCLHNTLQDACQICGKYPCEECDTAVNCERCHDWVCDACQTQCTHCGMSFCSPCVDECPHCEGYFCRPGAATHTGGWDEAMAGCLPPDEEGHGCPEWDEQVED